jgi:hypothetical protein
MKHKISQKGSSMATFKEELGKSIATHENELWTINQEVSIVYPKTTYLASDIILRFIHIRS